MNHKIGDECYFMVTQEETIKGEEGIVTALYLGIVVFVGENYLRISVEDIQEFTVPFIHVFKDAASALAKLSQILSSGRQDDGNNTIH